MRKSILRYGAISLGLACASIAAWFMATADAEIPPDKGPRPGADARTIARGRAVAVAADCGACHTATHDRPFAGGLVLSTPFGTIVTSNITPDQATGIGTWNQAAFARALRQGISRDGHKLYPAMPYPNYALMTDADVHDLKAYIDTLAPVRQANPPSALTFPFGFRPLLSLWNALFFRPETFKPDVTRSQAWNRGAYLVQGPGHCGVCHTAKNLLGGDRAFLQGGTLQGWHAPELSANAYTGLGQWPCQSIVDYLATGRAHEAIANGPMREVIEKSTSRMDRADLAAMATYLVTVPGSSRGAPRQAEGADLSGSGGDLFARYCSACHGSAGQGVHAMVPKLAGSAAVLAPDPDSLIRTVLDGGSGGTGMPAFAGRLDDREIAAVLTFIRATSGNAAPVVTAGDVAARRHAD